MPVVTLGAVVEREGGPAGTKTFAGTWGLF